MALLVGQIIYTSFPKVGFKSLISPQVPLEIRQSFLEHIVHQHWDRYDPPKADYRAAYFYQVSLEQNLFGWLYNDGEDDFGQSNIPYFIAYYLNEFLNIVQLETILTCLQKGPIKFIKRENHPHILEPIAIPDFCHYQATREGVRIASAIRHQCHNKLQQEELIDLFIPLDTKGKETQIDLPQEKININNSYVLTPSTVPPTEFESIPVKDKSISINSENELIHLKDKSISMKRIEAILQELMAKPIGIQGVVLVSAEGQLITTPLGIDENSTQVIAATILYLAKSTQEEFNWQRIESIAIRAQEGHLILTNCDSETFLLIKAGKVLTGLLEGEIHRTIKKLQVELPAITEAALA